MYDLAQAKLRAGCLQNYKTALQLFAITPQTMIHSGHMIELNQRGTCCLQYEAWLLCIRKSHWHQDLQQ